MPEWFRRRYFYSIKSMKRTLVSGYLISFLAIGIWLMFWLELKQHGYFTVKGISYSGMEIIVPFYGVLICSIIALGSTLYLTIYGFVLVKMNILRDLAEKYICSECESTFERATVGLAICKKCGGPLEDLDGFYIRHPEKKVNAG